MKSVILRQILDVPWTSLRSLTYTVRDMKTSLATTLSIMGILATGGVAMAVNTTVLDSTVSSVEGAPVLAEANVPISAMSADLSNALANAVPVDSTVPGETVSIASETTVGSQSVQSAYNVEGSGIITLEQNGSSLNVISVNPVSGWTYESVNERVNRVKVEFKNGTQQVEFIAELIDGRVVTAVEAIDTSVTASPNNDDDNESHDVGDDNGDNNEDHGDDD